MRLTKLAKLQTSHRPSFTLIELLVVIAIIGVLMSLLLAAVFKVMDKADEAANRNDITQLATAIQTFQSRFQVDYIPSRLFLGKHKADYFQDYPTCTVFRTPTHLYQDSWQYLNKLWPRLIWNQSAHQGDAINWGGTAEIQELDGGQCVVFFLGGIPANGGLVGFSTSPTDPSTPGGDRISFFDFKANRLSAAAADGGYPRYLDTYGKKPFAYFSSYKTPNNYNRYVTLTERANSDCFGAVYGTVWPYAQNWTGTHQYVNPNTFQLISAGKNATFGTGTNATTGTPLYTPGVTNLPINNGGYDDIANFYDRFLGIASN
jgi:prepilin-type N-terminal cleavage/methylation domain-containing protein